LSQRELTVLRSLKLCRIASELTLKFMRINWITMTMRMRMRLRTRARIRVKSLRRTS
ncbi:hypothetical protein BGX20_006800, partial [Mortierella sp. AD010]